MDIPEKTVYAGSFFQVENAGREYIISEFQNAHGDDAPFVGYDEKHNAFHFKSNDPETINLFLGTLGRAIELWTSRKDNDLTDSLRIQPLPNTTLPTDSAALRIDDLRLPKNALVDFEHDSDDSTENSSSAEGGNGLYWQPACGDTSILSQDVAIAVADVTECFIFRQADNKRVHLMNGNTGLALEKLNRLEPLLEMIFRHRDGPTARVDQSLLCLSSENPGNGVLFAPVTIPPHIDRVMVHPALEDQLEHMLIPEERHWNNTMGRYTKPENLKLESKSATDSFRATIIWATFEMPAIGNPVNALPKPSPTSSTVSSSMQPAAVNRKLQPSIFLAANEQANVREWSMNVDRSADPQLAAEKPIEPVSGESFAKEPASRRVVADSDSDEDEVVKQAPKDAAKEASTRRLVIDSDSDDDGIPKKSIKNTGNSFGTPSRQMLKSTTEAGLDSARSLPLQMKSGNVAMPLPIVQLALPTSVVSTNNQVISADDFYAGIPREDEAEQESAKELSQPQQHSSSVRQAIPPADKAKRGFGYDGTFDELEKGDEPSDPTSQRGSPPNQHLPRSSFNNLPDTEDDLAPQTRPVFDPSRYGLLDRSSRQTQSHQRPDTEQQDEWTPVKLKRMRPPPRNYTPDRHQDVQGPPSPPVPTMPRLGPNPQSRGRKVQRGGQHEWNQMGSRAERLIDIDEDDEKSPTDLKPPPGFDLRNDFSLSHMEGVGIQKPAQKPFTDHVTSQAEDNMFSSSSSSTGRNSLFEYVPQTHIPKPDINYMRNSILGSLQTLRQAKKGREVKSETSPVLEKIADDEESSRKFYNTMNLQAGNPGKSKKKGKPPSSKKDDASDTAALRAKRIEEAYGPVKPTANNTKSRVMDNTTQLSQKAQKIASNNPAWAALHGDTLQSASRSVLLKNLSHNLEAMFKVASVFSGTLNFEIQFGQVLVQQSSKIRLKHVYEPHKWSQLFDESDSSVKVYFSEILSNNGADIDRVLESKLKGAKVWSKNTPGRSKVVLQFKCQDQTGSEFLLECDEKGNHYITKGVVEIGNVGIHCPGKTWDACVTLNGTPRWQDIPQELITAVDGFVKDLHIKPGPIMTVFHRIPAKSTLTVQDVVLRRISLHQSLVEGEEELLLQITENRTLYTQSHQKDKRLFKSFETVDYSRMAKDHQVFYNASISHRKISDSFVENKDLEVGESRSTEPLTNQLMTNEYLQPLINAAIRQVDQIDWMGLQNYGTIQYKYDLTTQRAYEMANTVPPTAIPSRFARPVHASAGFSVAGPRSIVTPRTVVPGTYEQVGHPIYGVRMGEYATLYRDPDGSLYRLGRGGARVPLSKDDQTGIVDQDVTPDDSASQVETSRKVKPLSRPDDKPDDFW